MNVIKMDYLFGKICLQVVLVLMNWINLKLMELNEVQRIEESKNNFYKEWGKLLII